MLQMPFIQALATGRWLHKLSNFQTVRCFVDIP